MNRKFGFLLSFAMLLCACSSARAQEHTVFDIWEFLPSASRPQARLHVFLPQESERGARSVLILPGGGYAGLAVGHEGTDWAEYFCPRGIALFVLEYRMPAGQCGVPLADVRRALQFIRSKAGEWKIDAARVGIMGSSAGGHLAATAVAWLPAGERPAFQILLYPVVTMEEGVTHAGSRRELLGSNPLPAWVDHYSIERHVTSAFPPAFIALSGDDGVVPPRNSLQYYAALQQAGVSAGLHIYPTGGHGWGYRSSFKWHEQLLAELDAWLDSF